MLNQPRVSACIVLYHSGKQAVQAVQSVLNSQLPVELYIVDNAPDDLQSRLLMVEYPENEYPQVHYLPQEENLGYGQGNNAVLKQLRSEYHLIMNPDVTFDPELIGRMVAFMDRNRDVGILTPHMFFPDGTEQHVPRRQPTIRYMASRSLGDRYGFAKKWRDSYTLADREIVGPVSVQFASGCFMLIRKNLFYMLGGFDPRFFLYHEDSDLSLRVLQAGRKIVYHPDFCINHSWTRESFHNDEARREHLRSTWRFFMKWGWKW